MPECMCCCVHSLSKVRTFLGIEDGPQEIKSLKVEVRTGFRV